MLDAVDVPDDAALLWSHYWRARSGESLTYREIESYQTLTGYTFEPWEVRVLIEIDRSVQDEIAKQRDKQ